MLGRIGRRALLVALGLTVAVVLLEGLLQMAARVATPRRMARGADLAEARVAVYGDSTPYGLGNAAAFPELLARETALSVANRSWPGLNSTQVARILAEDLQRTSPPVLVVMAGVNDGWNLEDVPPALLGAAAPWYGFLPRLRVVRLLAIGVEAGLGRGEFDAAVPRGWSQRDETARLLSNAALRQILSASYRRMRNAADARGARILFLGYQAEGDNHVADLAEEVLREEHPDRLLALRSFFWRDGARRMIQADHFHPDDEGQRLIATRLAEELRSRGWLGAQPGTSGP